MKFQCALLAVKDVEASKKFYGELFDQRVVLDLGKNVTFSGGFAIQEDFAWLTGLPAESVQSGAHNMELYFEAEDFDAFLAKLDAYPGVALVHPPKKYDWQQRVLRLYDPDRHIIEVGESMAVIAKRYLAEGLSVEETAAKLQHPVEFVQGCKRSMEGEAPLEYCIENIGEISIIGMSRRVGREGAFTEIPKFWAEYYAPAERPIPGYLGVCFDEGGTDFPYYIAAFWDGETPVPEGYETRTIAPHTWARFRSVGKLPETLQGLNRRIFGQWLPENREYELAAPINIEMYNEGDVGADDYVSEIWVPVKKK